MCLSWASVCGRSLGPLAGFARQAGEPPIPYSSQGIWGVGGGGKLGYDTSPVAGEGRESPAVAVVEAEPLVTPIGVSGVL
jgi:hypothetical protein